MATTPYHARQLIIHGHVTINDRVINSPSYFITPSEENQISFAQNSPLRNASHKALPSNVYKTRQAEERGQAQRRGAIRGKLKKKAFLKEEIEKPKIAEEDEEEEKAPLLLDIEEEPSELEEKAEEVESKLVDKG